MLKSHDHYMTLALREAEKAYAASEVPTGCVIVATAPEGPVAAGTVVGRAHNQVETLRDATAHAEMIAITQAASALGDWRLTDTVLYVTKEPCAMCAGAIVLARIPTVVYGAIDPRRGGDSVFGILDHASLIHRAEIVRGVQEEACAGIIKQFFRQRRLDRADRKGTGHE
jgi:tRNA(adenine34) deaminase